MANLELPIFPLPQSVLLPHALVPLHVFEPRYRALVSDCLAGNRQLAFPTLVAGWEEYYDGRPAVRPIACYGEIIDHEPLSDGRSNILVRGIGRITIQDELPAREAYRVVKALTLDCPSPTPDLESALTALRGVCDAVAANLPSELGAALRHLALVSSDPGEASDLVAAAVISDASDKRSIVEAIDVGERIDLVTALLAGIAAKQREETPGN